MSLVNYLIINYEFFIRNFRRPESDQILYSIILQLLIGFNLSQWKFRSFIALCNYTYIINIIRFHPLFINLII